MDLSMSRLSAISEPVAQEPRYPTFAAPTPIRGYVGNTLTPGSLPSPLNFPSITPPSSPYSFPGLYSPAGSSHSGVSPLCDPAYLKRLKSNPIFRDLQSVLLQDCLQMEVPASLITTSWNLMQLHKPQAPPTSCQAANDSTGGSGQKVYIRHMALQDKLLKVRIDPAISADGLAVENTYSKEVGNVEMKRYHALNSCPSDTIKATINCYYDKERLNLADNTEEKLDLLIAKAETMRQAARRANSDCLTTAAVTKPSADSAQGRLPKQDSSSSSSQGASLLLQPIEESDSARMNAVRKLRFNISDEHVVDIEEEENDYLNGSVNSEDFEIDEIDVETVDHDLSPTYREETGAARQDLSPPTSEGSDLLQQCIEESGLDMDVVTSTSGPHSDSDNSVSAVIDCAPARTSLPDTLTATTSTPKIDISSDSYHSNQDIHFGFREVPRKSYQPSQELFGTPQNFGFMFSQPDKLNQALSDIGKLCGGPPVTFTPELRREATSSFTPEMPGLSPLTSVCDGLSQPSQPVTSHYSRQWTSPADTATIRTGSGQKRKSPFDDEYSPEEMDNHNQVTSATDANPPLLNNPVFKTHRMLTAEATTVLNQWYTAHVQYPYPSDEEVRQLSQVTGITGRQVKKWMANKRVRCFNTLSITGNQHPIKFKYNGCGRKKKTPVEKENCDSTTHDKKANYSLLSDDAKLVLNNWYEHHKETPYPNDDEKQQLATLCNISVGQVKSWFANKRNRTNNTKRQVPNYFINKFPEYQGMVQFVGQRREEARMIKRRKINQMNMYIQPNFYF